MKYIKGAYTTDKHNLIIGIQFFQVGWRWHSYSHSNYVCLNVTFDYSTLEAYFSKTKNDRNKQISDPESWHIEGFTRLRQRYNCTNNIHAQRDAQKHCFIYPRNTLMHHHVDMYKIVHAWKCPLIMESLSIYLSYPSARTLWSILAEQNIVIQGTYQQFSCYLVAAVHIGHQRLWHISHPASMNHHLHLISLVASNAGHLREA